MFSTFQQVTKDWMEDGLNTFMFTNHPSWGWWTGTAQNVKIQCLLWIALDMSWECWNILVNIQIALGTNYNLNLKWITWICKRGEVNWSCYANVWWVIIKSRIENLQNILLKKPKDFAIGLSQTYFQNSWKHSSGHLCTMRS